jgi:hypothetical protein
LVRAVARVVAGETPRVGRRLVALRRGARRRGADVHRRLQFPPVLAVMPHGVLCLRVPVMSHGAHTSLHQAGAEVAANTRETIRWERLQFQNFPFYARNISLRNNDPIRDSSVDIATDYGLEGRGLIPGRNK